MPTQSTAKKPLVIITGASSGIGRALSLVFSEVGCSLGLLSRNKSSMEDLKLSSALSISTDVTHLEEVKQSIARCEEEFGPVDCLINNAGFGKDGEFTSLPHEVNDRMVQTNVMGVINTIEAVLPSMQARKTGTIINISSLAANHPRPHLATYAASKAAVKSLTESLRMANAKHGIRFCNVAPAKIQTPMLIQSNLNDEEVISAEALSKTILWIYQQPQTICIRDMVIAPTYYES